MRMGIIDKQDLLQVRNIQVYQINLTLKLFSLS